MARAKGARYESDRRRWFRLDSEGLAAGTAELTDAEFRAFILTLAYANEHKAQERGDRIFIARSQVMGLSPNARNSVTKSIRVLQSMTKKLGWEITGEGANGKKSSHEEVANESRTGREQVANESPTVLERCAKLTIWVRKYSQKQGFAPKCPDKTPMTTPTPTTTPTNKKGKKPNVAQQTKEGSPAARARSVWHKLVKRAAMHGVTWSPNPGVNQVKIVADRIRDGATDEQLERAVEGYIRKNGYEARDGFDPLRHFTASTIFRPTKFDGYVEGSYLPPAKKPRSPAGPAPETATQRRDRLERERLRAQVERERAERAAMGESDDAEAVGEIIDIALGKARAGG